MDNKQHTFRSRIGWLFLSLLVIAADQLSKWSITEMVFRPQLGQPGIGIIDWYKSAPSMLPPVQIEMTSFFNLAMVWNTGVSFGMMGGQGGNAPLILICLSTAITIFFTLWLLRTHDKLQSFCFALIIGGALGNIIDRARFGAVIDFLDFHAFGHHWPAFNVADMAVVAGVGLFIILSLAFDLLGKDVYRNPTSSKDVQ